MRDSSRPSVSTPRENSKPTVRTPSVDGGVGDRSTNDRMLNGGQEMPDMIILGYLAATLVAVHFGRHRSRYVAGIRRTRHPVIDARPSDHFRFTLHDQQAVVNQFSHCDCTQVSRGRKQIPVDMMIERLGAKGINFQLVDQILNRVRKFSFGIREKLGQRSLGPGSGCCAKIIREIKMNTVDLCHLRPSNSRESW